MRVLLADGEPRVRSALRLLLGQDPDLSVVAEVTNAAELFDHVRGTCPDLLLLDWELPGPKGIHVFGLVHRRCPQLPVIALSVRPEARQAALAAGARAFVSKGDPPERLLAAMHDCLRQRDRSEDERPCTPTIPRQSA